MRPVSTLLMVRHAESTANLASRYTWHDHEPLTELGHRQAREAGRLLAEQYEPSHLYCSRFRRARQTADEIAAEVGLPVVEIDGIEERCFGELRGKPWEVYRPISTSRSSGTTGRQAGNRSSTSRRARHRWWPGSPTVTTGGRSSSSLTAA